jgi:hypothetical protein
VHAWEIDQTIDSREWDAGIPGELRDSPQRLLRYAPYVIARTRPLVVDPSPSSRNHTCRAGVHDMILYT